MYAHVIFFLDIIILQAGPLQISQHKVGMSFL